MGPKGAMVSTDIGNVCSVSNSYLRFDEPQSMFAAMTFGMFTPCSHPVCCDRICCIDQNQSNQSVHQPEPVKSVHQPEPVKSISTSTRTSQINQYINQSQSNQYINQN